MTHLQKYNTLFPGHKYPEIDPDDQILLAYHTGNTTYLVKGMKTATEKELRWMLAYEASGRDRPDITERIIARLMSLERRRLRALCK